MMQNGPKLWAKLLDESPKGSVLMGGACIDWMLGHEAKDYDIFHTYKVGEPFNGAPPIGWKKTDVHFNDPVWAKAHQELYLQGGVEGHANPIGSVYEFMVDGEHKVQLIGVHYENPAQHMKNFDHTLTLARWSKNGMFTHRKAYETFDTHIIEYVSKDKSAEARSRSIWRAMNKIEKYGDDDWELVGFHN